MPTIPNNMLCNVSTHLGGYALQAVDMAKSSSYIPSPVKTRLESGVEVAEKIASEKLTPLLEKADSCVDTRLVVPLNGKISEVMPVLQPYVDTVSESYQEGGLRKVTGDVITMVDKHVEPMKEDIKTAYTEGGLRQVVSDVAVPTVTKVNQVVLKPALKASGDIFITSKRRVADTAVDLAKKNKKVASAFAKEGVKQLGLERASDIVYTNLIEYAAAMDSGKDTIKDTFETRIVPQYQNLSVKATEISQQSMQYIREADIQTIKADLIAVSSEAKRIGAGKLEVAVDQMQKMINKQKLVELKGLLAEKVVANGVELRASAKQVVETMQSSEVFAYFQPILARLKEVFAVEDALIIAAPAAEPSAPAACEEMELDALAEAPAAAAWAPPTSRDLSRASSEADNFQDALEHMDDSSDGYDQEIPESAKA